MIANRGRVQVEWTLNASSESTRARSSIARLRIASRVAIYYTILCYTIILITCIQWTLNASSVSARDQTSPGSPPPLCYACAHKKKKKKGGGGEPGDEAKFDDHIRMKLRRKLVLTFKFCTTKCTGMDAKLLQE